ncbi:hypothetical protein Droror1_Dr00025527 [Drosera rotundifolia]
MNGPYLISSAKPTRFSFSFLSPHASHLSLTSFFSSSPSSSPARFFHQPPPTFSIAGLRLSLTVARNPSIESDIQYKDVLGKDTEGFVIPSLGIEEIHQDITSTPELQPSKPSLKEADRKAAGTGRENKIDSLRELVGSKSKLNGNSGKGSSRDWLDPHCDESQFEKRRPK